MQESMALKGRRNTEAGELEGERMISPRYLPAPAKWRPFLDEVHEKLFDRAVSVYYTRCRNAGFVFLEPEREMSKAVVILDWSARTDRSRLRVVLKLANSWDTVAWFFVPNLRSRKLTIRWLDPNKLRDVRVRWA